jgi:hypothetical protein
MQMSFSNVKCFLHTRYHCWGSLRFDGWNRFEMFTRHFVIGGEAD